MIGYLFLLLALSWLVATLRIMNPQAPLSLLQHGGVWRLMAEAAAVVLIYVLVDLLWTYLRDRVWYVPTSSVISGLVLSLVALPAGESYLIFVLPIVAAASKHLLRFGKIRHLMNPAAFAMVALSLFSPLVVSWSGVSWGIQPVIPIVLVGVLILWRLERFHIAVSFLISYIVFLTLSFLVAGQPLGPVLAILRSVATDGTLLFFSSVMLVEPITSSYPTRLHGVIYGIIVALTGVLVAHYVQSFANARIPYDVLMRGDYPFWFNLSVIDPLLLGLLVGNFVTGLLFVPKRILNH